MKKILLCAAGMLLPFFLVSAAQAGAIDNKTNWSAEYVRTLNRNAATDFADIAAYNPAGTVKLHEGFTVNGSVQYLSKDYENNITIAPGTTLGLESDEPSYIPGIFAVYNKKRFSIFGAFSNVGGGGKVDFSQGDASTLKIASSLLGLPLCGGSTCVNLGSQQLSAESYYLGYTLGGAYAFNDMVSISIGMRYVNATRKANGSATIWDAGYTNSFKAAIDYEQEDNGWGGIFGLNLAPNDQVNIAMRYETKTSLDLEATVNAGAPILAGLDPAIINGQSIPRDLPAIFAFGISYKLNPTMRVEANYTTTSMKMRTGAVRKILLMTVMMLESRLSTSLTKNSLAVSDTSIPNWVCPRRTCCRRIPSWMPILSVQALHILLTRNSLQI